MQAFIAINFPLSTSLAASHELWYIVSSFSLISEYFLISLLIFSLTHKLLFLKNTLFIYLWLCWVFASVRGLPPAAASGGHSSSRCTGLSLSRPLLLRSTGSSCAGSAIVAHGPSHSTACGNPPRPGLEPVSPALAGRLSTTAPPGKPP